MSFTWPARKLTLAEMAKLRDHLMTGKDPGVLHSLAEHTVGFVTQSDKNLYLPLIRELFTAAVSTTVAAIRACANAPARPVMYQDAYETSPIFDAVPIDEVESVLRSFISHTVDLVSRDKINLASAARQLLRIVWRTGYCLRCAGARNLPWTVGPPSSEKFPGMLIFGNIPAGSPLRDAIVTRAQTFVPNPEWLTHVVNIAGVCGRTPACTWTCVDCGAAPAFSIDSPDSVSMVTENACRMCTVGKLTSVQPPKPNRAELKGLRRRISLKG